MIMAVAPTPVAHQAAMYVTDIPEKWKSLTIASTLEDVHLAM